MTCETQRQTIFTRRNAGVSQRVYARQAEPRERPPVLPLRTTALPLPPTRDQLRLKAPSEDRDKVLNTIPRILGDTLRDPRDSSDLLFLQLEVSIEH